MYNFLRWCIGVALGFYFRRIERFHPERVPASGPVLFTSNHPSSLSDSFLIGSSVPRKVNFVATVQMFRFRLVKWVLSRCGVIPINRLKDDPRAMRTVADTFEACYRVLERGEAVGIFPEGITYDDSQLKEVKSGAARMALELEHRHGGKLGLQIVPLGLTLSAKELYRSDALVNFGEPIRAAEFLEGYDERRKECIVRLTSEIEHRIQALLVHLPKLEHARVVEGVKRLYLEQLRLGQSVVQPPAIHGHEDLQLSQRLVESVERAYREKPQLTAEFAARLSFYERWLARLRISEEHLALFPRRAKLASQSLIWAAVAILGAPLALYGWVHRLVPYAVVKWALRKFPAQGKRKAQTATTAILAGTVAFAVCYSAFVAVFYRLFGWPSTLWYALSLPVASLLAHYYLRELRKLLVSLRNTIVLMRAPMAARRLLALRAELIAESEALGMGVMQINRASAASL